MTMVKSSGTWLWGIVALCLAVPGIGFGQQTVNLVKNGDAETGALDGWTGFNKVVSEGAHGGRHAFYASGHRTVQTARLIEIEATQKYTLSGWFKSAGKEPSTVYFGFVCFDAGGRRIEGQRVSPVAGTETTLVEACKKEDRVLKIADGSKWEKHSNAYVAFNIDDSGAYADLPNWNLSPPNVISVENKGAHWEMTLEKPCGHSYPAGAKVREHDSGAGAMYSVMVGGKVPMQWQQYKAMVQGVAKAGVPGNQWWPGTRSVRVLVLANYQQTPEQAELLVDDLAIEGPAPAPVEKKPVALYTFEEGEGDVLTDHSGKGNHGKIVGAKWTPLGKKWALEFDGKNAYVDFGSSRTLDPRDAFTLEAWIYVEPVHSIYYSVPILGSLVGCVREIRIASNCAGQLPQRRWVHIAQVFDGNNGNNRIYLDGQLQTHQAAVSSRVVALTAKSFLIGEERPAEQNRFAYYADRSRFKGMVAEVRLYNRALTHEEVLADVRSTNVTSCPIPSPLSLPGLGRVKVQIDAARLGVPLKGVSVIASVRAGRSADAAPLATATVKEFDDRGRAIVDIDVPDLPRGDYIVRAVAQDAAGKPVGVAGEEALAWPGSAHFPAGPEGARKLNNLVTELLYVKGPDGSGKPLAFVNPRNGFIYVANKGSKEVTLTPEGGQPAPLMLSQDFGPAFETIRYLPQGTYTLATARAENLVVRAVAETIYDVSPASPYVPQFGPYEGAFEERYVFPHVTTITTSKPDHPPLTVWRAKGRRILWVTTLRYQQKEGQSKVDAMYDKLVSEPGFSHPVCDGYALDEFAASEETSALWGPAIDGALSDPRFKGKVIHCFSYALSDFVGGYVPERPTHPGRDLVRVLRKHDSAVLWECYAKDRRSEFNGLWWHNDKILGEFVVAKRGDPDLADTLIVTPYAYVAGVQPWMVQTLPVADWRVVLDRQFQLLATHPEYAGLHGIMTYRSNYADEEIVRFGARLFRHYAIEGNTERFCKDPYELVHIRNPEFEEQGKEWTLKPAEKDSIKFDIYNQLGVYQGRYNLVAEGDTGLVTRRCANAPNTFSQEMHGLEPGRLYSFRMLTMDRTDNTRGGQHAVNITFTNAELLPDKSFTHVADWATRRGWARKPWYTNYHYRIFRATGDFAILTISDWATDDEPGGPIGQELMYNFIKVQPYWPAD